jgi:sigma-B regulation protein RsbU (phosphoserine phosphatase)
VTDPGVKDFWENAPCGHLIAHPDGRIIRVNATLSRWLGYERNALCGKLFSDLLTIGGRILYDTHFGPLLHMGGDLNGVTVDVVTADGTRLPVFLTANVKSDADQKPELLQITVLDAADRRAYETELLQARQQAEKEQGRVRVFADTLRRALLPPVLSPPAGLDAADYYYTASVDDVGGDFYDLFPLSRTTWGFFLGDVAGKGVDAAVVSGLTRYTLRAAAVYDDDPVQVLHNVNTVLSQKLRGDRIRFCTLIYGKLTWCDNGFDVELASGGHPPPLLFYADGSAYYVDTTGGQAVGITAEPRFVASRFLLAPGDTLLLYTDGLTEASTGVGHERYNDEGALLRFAKSHAPTTASAIVDAVHRLLDGLGSGVEDDTAVLALSVPRREELGNARNLETACGQADGFE